MTRAYRISALVKCHNEELFLRQCIESIRPLVDEIVVVDNNSTDSSREIAMQLGVKVVDFAGDPGGSIGLADYYNWCAGPKPSAVRSTICAAITDISGAAIHCAGQSPTSTAGHAVTLAHLRALSGCD
jgi:glycosyltransferase involved in cell wall biosynthesis